MSGREGKLFGKDGRIAKDRIYPMWRAGANAATKLHTEADLVIGGLSVPKGDYTLFVDIRIRTTGSSSSQTSRPASGD